MSFFACDGCTDAELPAWDAERKPVDEPASFAEAIRDLPRAVETRMADQNPDVDEWVETDRFNAIVEPTDATAVLLKAGLANRDGLNRGTMPHYY